MNKELLIKLRPEIVAHQEADRFIQGVWLSDEKTDGLHRGSFFSCAMQTSNTPVTAFCEKYDVPLWLGMWVDSVFEGLGEAESIEWPLQFLDALIAFDGDLVTVQRKLAIKRLTCLAELNTCGSGVKYYIERVINYHDRLVTGTITNASIPPLSSTNLKSERAILTIDCAILSIMTERSYSTRRSAEYFAYLMRTSPTCDNSSKAWQLERDWMLEILKESSQ